MLRSAELSAIDELDLRAGMEVPAGNGQQRGPIRDGGELLREMWPVDVQCTLVADFLFFDLESLKIVLPLTRNAYSYKIDVFVLSQKTTKKTSILESKIHKKNP